MLLVLREWHPGTFHESVISTHSPPQMNDSDRRLRNSVLGISVPFSSAFIVRCVPMIHSVLSTVNGM